MSATKWHENDYTLPSHLIASMPERRNALDSPYDPFKKVAVVSGVTVTPDNMMDSGFSCSCMPLVGFDLMTAED